MKRKLPPNSFARLRCQRKMGRRPSLSGAQVACADSARRAEEDRLHKEAETARQAEQERRRRQAEAARFAAEEALRNGQREGRDPAPRR